MFTFFYQINAALHIYDKQYMTCLHHAVYLLNIPNYSCPIANALTDDNFFIFFGRMKYS